MAFRPAIGDSDFLSIRRQDAVYVDKTAAVVELALSATKVTQFTRPRRFGKSTLLSTLEAFFQRADLIGDTSPFFADLAVWRSEDARRHHQRYPVLALSFKDVATLSWADSRRAIRRELASARRGVEPLLLHLPADLKRELDTALDPDGEGGDLAGSIKLLCEALHAATGAPAVLLIDEYDSPLHAAWQHGYLEEALAFFRMLFGAALKENRHLHKAIITGILRVARESLFSTVNHLEVWSILQDGFADAFGFTQAEVEALARAAGLEDRLPELEAWYNGYLVGSTRLYNPWSVLSFFKNPKAGPQPYWVNTGGTALVESLLQHHGIRAGAVVERLLRGEALSTTISESLIFPDLTVSVEAVWSLLLAAGYLKPRSIRQVDGEVHAELVIPNQEVGVSWRQMASRALRHGLRSSDEVDRLTRAMLAGDEARFGDGLRTLAVNALSYHDLAGDWPERVWQAFVLGILVHLDAGWEVRSNPEMGYGRADVVVRPRQPGRPGVILELKRIEDGQDVDAALTAALQQIDDRDYGAGLREVASPLRRIAVVFEGKRPHVRVRG